MYIVFIYHYLINIKLELFSIFIFLIYLVNWRGAGWRFSAMSGPPKKQPEPVDNAQSAE
jgi:hypothetical protein